MGGGHYTTYAKNFANGLWYDFNDSYTSSVDPSRIVSRQAYVLFYRRRALASGAVHAVAGAGVPRAIAASEAASEADADME